jgi:hypothetical protein
VKRHRSARPVKVTGRPCLVLTQSCKVISSISTKNGVTTFLPGFHKPSDERAVMPSSILRDLHRWFRPVIDALFTWNLPWQYRWRLLLLQPMDFITSLMKTVPFIFKKPYTVEWIPITTGQTVRVLVFRPKDHSTSTVLCPIHISIHGGAFSKMSTLR